MDGHESEYPDYYSQSSSPVDLNGSGPTFPPIAGDFGVFSQAPSYGVGSFARHGMEGLDLNTDVAGFPYMGSYQGLLQGDFAPSGRGLLPLRIGARSGAGGFVPPRPTAGATGSEKRLASRAAMRRSRVGARSSRARAPATRLRGTVASASSAPPTEGMDSEDDDDIPHEVSLFSDLIRTLLCLLSMFCMSYLWFCMPVFLLDSHTFH